MVNWSAGAGGAASGAAAGSVLGPWGTAIGAGIGGLAGLFGSGDSGPTAEQLRARANYDRLGGDLNAQADYLRRLASGQDSVSAEQLRQSLGQTMAQQRSMAASAAPQNQAMANIQASRNAMNLGSGLAGQQAVAGLQERQQAQAALSQLILQQRQQEQQVADFGQARPPSWLQTWGPAISQGAQLYAQTHGKTQTPTGQAQRPTSQAPNGWQPGGPSSPGANYQHWTDPNYSRR